jgi:hypothetical protein
MSMFCWEEYGLGTRYSHVLSRVAMCASTLDLMRKVSTLDALWDREQANRRGISTQGHAILSHPRQLHC